MTIGPLYDVADWYWFVGGDLTQVWSSAGAAYVLVNDATYLAWVAAGGAATAIASEDELADVLGALWPDYIPPTIEMWQGQAQLDADGTLAAAQAYVAGASVTLQQLFDNGNSWLRSSAALEIMADSIGYVIPDDWDQFFRDADAITA